MKKIIFILMLGISVYCYFGYHFILFDSSLKVLKKVELTAEDTFVDARGVKSLKLIFKPSLVKAGVKDLVKKEGITLKVE
ncbi:MAG: hypothetical protein GY714_14455 [Desulfobacterales bacterium]|nr:hypothetical protein [Desulfobacterales bacterium]MCP4158531.1 hypothetical protein [Deltaproteobacteria bacterium]